MINQSYEQAPVRGASAALRADLVSVIPQVRALARCLCADAQDADDLAYETLALALLRRNECDAAASLLNWCFGVELEVLHSRAWRAAAPRAFKRAPSALRRRALWLWAPMRIADAPAALEELSSDELEAVILVDAARRTVEEAAAICKSTPEVIGRLVDQARAKLDRVMVVAEVV